MPAAKFTPAGRPDPPLAEDELLRCGACDEQYLGEPYNLASDEGGWFDFEHGRPRCRVCDEFATLVRVRASASFAAKWGPNVGRRGWLMTPGVLLAHQGVLGISDRELVMLLRLEFRRRTPTLPVEPAQRELAAEGRDSKSKVEDILRDLRQRGIIESHGQRDDTGQRENRYTTNGLQRLLDHIAVNLHAGRAGADGLDALLDKLREEAGEREQRRAAARERKRAARAPS